ncbi:MAG: Acetyltransferase [Chlamydiia bacterium]|nr:Acetyltransferase [Chlamydiia bacterium]
MDTTQRLIIRPLEPRDQPAFIQMHQSEKVMQFFPSTLTQSQALQLFDTFSNQGIFAIETKKTHTFIGIIGRKPIDFLPHHPTELLYRIDAPYWRKGYATEAASALLIPDTIAITAKLNLPSQRLLEKLGMQTDPSEDFLHPNLPANHPLAPHMIYRSK